MCPWQSYGHMAPCSLCGTAPVVQRWLAPTFNNITHTRTPLSQQTPHTCPHTHKLDSTRQNQCTIIMTNQAMSRGRPICDTIIINPGQSIICPWGQFCKKRQQMSYLAMVECIPLGSIPSCDLNWRWLVYSTVAEKASVRFPGNICDLLKIPC